MALTKVQKTGITDNAIDADKIEDGTIVAADIAPGTITNAKLAGSIANDKLANSSITVNGSSVSLGGSVSAGKVQWQSVVTADGSTGTSATAGEGYFIDTTSAAHTLTLPGSPSAGDTIAIKDYAGTFGTNNLTIARNGNNIQGVANDSEISTNRASVVLVYIDATKGWLYTNESNVADLEKTLYVTATGGTIATSGDFKIHTFTGDGCFVVSCAGNPTGSTAVDYLVVAGGGGGGSGLGGGGGAGGYRTSFPSPGCNAGAFPISATTYPVTVGAGASPVATNEPGTSGSNSVFSTITSTGGGGGGGYTIPGSSGGSGGGGGGIVPAGSPTGGSGNTPPVSPPQGNNGGGGSGPAGSGGGGGGAGATGTTGTPPAGGPGGNGLANSITGSSVTYAGGGGGGTYCTSKTEGSGGSGGGGNGGRANDPQVPTPLTNGDAGSANTGGGGGGTGASGGGAVSGAGGKGIVIIRYKFQN
jgi:hypothetical protein